MSTVQVSSYELRYFILAATALPRFVDLSDAARESAIQGVAGALGSASALNHANNIANDAGLTITTPLVAVATCEAVANALDGNLPADAEIVTGTGTTIANGGVASEGGSSTCQVRSVQDNTIIANFTAFGVAI
jgi:MSHA pilin protein MshA